MLAIDISCRRLGRTWADIIADNKGGQGPTVFDPTTAFGMAATPGSYVLLPVEESRGDEGDGSDPPVEELGIKDEQPLDSSGSWCLLVQHASK